MILIALLVPAAVAVWLLGAGRHLGHEVVNRVALVDIK